MHLETRNPKLKRKVTGEMDSQVAAFFTTYYMLGSMVLLNVVIAVLLDQFQTLNPKTETRNPKSLLNPKP
jgi:hypothetical protein